MAPSHVATVCGVLTLLVFVAPPVCEGHGRLHEPASRATMWRHGFNNTINYMDNSLFCGGFSHQYDLNNGSCGVCGDPYDGERKHEAGGIYANGIITANYTQGEIMDVWVELTAHHKGYFEFKICAHNDVDTAVTQECLDEHPLHSWNDSNIRHYVGDEVRLNYYFSLQLPWLMSCEQCVFQWRYRAGNSWGTDEEGEGLGFGPQEEFRACADVRITPDASVTAPPPTTVPTTTTTTTTTTPVPTTTKALTCKPVRSQKNIPGMAQWCKDNCPAEVCSGMCKCK